MKNVTVSRRLMTIIVLAALLFGGMFAGAVVFDELDVFAESGDGEAGEVEDNGAEDEAEGEDVPITGTELERASAAALDYIGEGQVSDTEVGDEEGYYEVEITRDDGSQVDVHLDEEFNVLGHEDE